MDDKSRETGIAGKISCVKRYEPRRMFRLKVAIMSRFPSAGLRLADHRRGALGWGPTPVWQRSPRSFALAGAAAVLLIFIVFSSLMLSAGGSLPGDPLYAMKRARERLSLAFTFSDEDKAQKRLGLASERLSELDNLSQRDSIDPAAVEEIAREYSSETSAAAREMNSAGGSNPALLARKLQELNAEKENLLKRIAASSPSVLALAKGASVTVKDPQGLLVPGGQVSGKTDADGEYKFEVDLPQAVAAERLEVVIESDGRKQVTPLYPTRSVDSPYKVVAEPSCGVLSLDEPVTISLNISRADGSAVSSRRVKFADRSLSSTLNGHTAETTTWTNDRGCCPLTVTKTSADAVSTISMSVEDPAWTQPVQVMELGGLDAPEYRNGPVTVSKTGSDANLQKVQMYNKQVQVTARASRSGEVVSSFGPISGAVSAGPLYDEMPSVAKALGKECSVSGPRLVTASEKSSAYEMVLEVPLADGGIRKTYRVSLTDGEAYARVSCRTELTGSGIELVRENPKLVSSLVLASAAGRSYDICGNTVTAPGGPTEINNLSFQVAEPYFAYETGAGMVFVGYPLDSELYPQSVELTSTSIRAAGPAGINDPDSTSLMMLGFTAADGLADLVAKARSGSGAEAAVTEIANKGFLVVAEPGLSGLGKGEQKIVLQVYKEYEQAF